MVGLAFSILKSCNLEILLLQDNFIGENIQAVGKNLVQIILMLQCPHELYLYFGDGERLIVKKSTGYENI